MFHNAEHCRGADSGVGVAGPRWGGQQPSRACTHPGLGRCCRRNPVRCRADLFPGLRGGHITPDGSCRCDANSTRT